MTRCAGCAGVVIAAGGQRQRQWRLDRREDEAQQAVVAVRPVALSRRVKPAADLVRREIGAMPGGKPQRRPERVVAIGLMRPAVRRFVDEIGAVARVGARHQCTSPATASSAKRHQPRRDPEQPRPRCDPAGSHQRSLLPQPADGEFEVENEEHGEADPEQPAPARASIWQSTMPSGAIAATKRSVDSTPCVSDSTSASMQNKAAGYCRLAASTPQSTRPATLARPSSCASRTWPPDDVSAAQSAVTGLTLARSQARWICANASASPVAT